jgi:hypothetical protein
LSGIFYIHDALNAVYDLRQHRFAFDLEVNGIDVSVYLFNVFEIRGIDEAPGESPFRLRADLRRALGAGPAPLLAR